MWSGKREMSREGVMYFKEAHSAVGSDKKGRHYYSANKDFNTTSRSWQDLGVGEERVAPEEANRSLSERSIPSFKAHRKYPSILSQTLLEHTTSKVLESWGLGGVYEAYCYFEGFMPYDNSCTVPTVRLEPPAPPPATPSATPEDEKIHLSSYWY